MKMKLFFVVALTFVATVLADEPIAPPAPVNGIPVPGYSITNCVRPFDAAAADKTSVGYQFWFADNAFANGNTVKLSVVGPHLATHAPHRHVEDEYFFVLEGTAEFYLDGERKVAGPMTLFYCPSWHEHGIRNVGDTDMKYLVLKKYLHLVPLATDVKQVPGAAQLPAPKAP